MGKRHLSETQKETLLDVQTRAEPPGLGTLALSAREDALAEWMDDHGIPESAARRG